MNNSVELLAPAGNYEAFLAAVENGADAVYLGGRLFNARQFAGNFDGEQLQKAVDYAHARAVKLYITMNTLVSDEEMDAALDFAEEVYRIGADGVIVQDLGLAALIRKLFPDMELHGSTQMTVYNLEGVKLLQALGFKRVVLARELSLQEIRHITQNTPLEIEIFIHGALCISYSGQCLMSSMLGGRSGNRGKCAQPCRLPYELVSDGKIAGNKGYLMSPKDISSIELIDKVVGSGVRSLKIEGRMKTPEYVATVVRLYRKYIDKFYSGDQREASIKVQAGDLKELSQIFNRGGFSTGYLEGKQGSDMMSYRKPKNWGVPLGEVLSADHKTGTVTVKLSDAVSIGDGVEVWNGEEENPGNIVTAIHKDGKSVKSAGNGDIATLGSIKGRITKGNKVYKTSDKLLNEKAGETYSGRFLKRVGIEGQIDIRENSPARLTVWDDKGNRVEAAGEIAAEKAVNRPLTEERIREQLGKTGSTPYDFIRLRVEAGENLSLPVSELNNLRRRALEALENARTNASRRNLSEENRKIKENLKYSPGNSRKEQKKVTTSVCIYDYNPDVDYTGLETGRIYFPFKAFQEGSEKKINSGSISRFREKGIEVFAGLPAVTRGNYDRLVREKLQDIVHMGVDGVLVGNGGSVELVRGLEKIALAGDFPLNAFNSHSLEALEALGFEQATLSPEMTLHQIQNLKALPHLKKEALAYGRIPLMTSEYCPVGSVAGGMKKDAACSSCCKGGVFRLKDRKGVEFPVWCDRVDCRSTIFNSNVLLAVDAIDRLKASGIDMLRISITDEEPGEILRIVEMHKDLIENGEKAIKRHESLIGRLKSKGFTKGHYFRGV